MQKIDATISYSSYLKVPELLALQQPVADPAHRDELLFIIIHQVYELWFRQVLHEIDVAVGELDRDRVTRARKAFKRIHAIQRVLEGQVDVLETMTPQEFNAFRSALNPASGFQSAQFREIEVRCGVHLPAAALRHLDVSDAERARLERRLLEPTLYDAVKAYLARAGFAVATPAELLATLRSIYEDEDGHVERYLLMEDLIEFDERFLLWRGRHVRMVERMIGAKPGTGGSLGAAYLQTTLTRRFFPEIWEVRTLLENVAE